MAPRFRTRSTAGENLRVVLHAIPWKLLLLLPLLVVIAIPTYMFVLRMGKQTFPTITNLFYTMSVATVSPTAFSIPTLPEIVPQVGSILYTIGDGDSCDSVLTYQMNMNDAGQIFSDTNPATVKALNATLGKDCHTLQPGMVVRLSPHYPLLAFGGVVLKVDAPNSQQIVPTPLIRITQQPFNIDCSGGCNLTVRLTSSVQVHLLVQTTLVVHPGSWIWAQAMYVRKKISGFDTYPYVDPNASLNGMSLSACDFQVGNIHDNNSLACNQLAPNTINDDGGSWLFGVTGPSGLAHWGYQPKLPAGTRVLLWLSKQQGDLKFQAGNPAYRYDEPSHRYVKL